MNHNDHWMLETIYDRLKKVTFVLEETAGRDVDENAKTYRLCAELLDEQCDRMDEVLNPPGAA